MCFLSMRKPVKCLTTWHLSKKICQVLIEQQEYEIKWLFLHLFYLIYIKYLQVSVNRRWHSRDNYYVRKTYINILSDNQIDFDEFSGLDGITYLQTLQILLKSFNLCCSLFRFCSVFRFHLGIILISQLNNDQNWLFYRMPIPYKYRSGRTIR